MKALPYLFITKFTGSSRQRFDRKQKSSGPAKLVGKERSTITKGKEFELLVKTRRQKKIVVVPFKFISLDHCLKGLSSHMGYSGEQEHRFLWPLPMQHEVLPVQQENISKLYYS